MTVIDVRQNDNTDTFSLEEKNFAKSNFNPYNATRQVSRFMITDPSGRVGEVNCPEYKKKDQLRQKHKNSGIEIAIEYPAYYDDRGELVHPRRYMGFRTVASFQKWRQLDLRSRFAHEIPPSRGKPYFDLERKYSTTPATIDNDEYRAIVEKELKEIFSQFTPRSDEIKFAWMFNQVEKPGKFSCHLVLPNVYLEMLRFRMRYVATLLKEALRKHNLSDTIDMMPYNTDHPLKLVYSEKREARGYWLVPQDGFTEEDTYVTYRNPDDDTIKPNIIVPKAEEPIGSNNIVEDESKIMRLLMACYEKLTDKDNLKIDKNPHSYKGNPSLLLHKSKRCDCCVCGKKDSKRAHSLYWNGSGVVRTCLHQGVEKTPIILCESETMKTKQQSEKRKAELARKKQEKERALKLIPDVMPVTEGFDRTVELADLTTVPIDDIIDLAKKVNIIQSPMGSRKTDLIVKLLKECPDASCIYMSTRVAFMNDVGDRLKEHGFIKYKDFKKSTSVDPEKPLKLVMSLESIMKCRNIQFDYVIIDECEAVWNQLNANTYNGREQATYDEFERILEESSNIICMDAFITPSTFAVMGKKFPVAEIHSVTNTKASKKRSVIHYVDKGTFVDEIVGRAMEGRKFVIPSASASFIKKIERALAKAKYDMTKFCGITALMDDQDKYSDKVLAQQIIGAVETEQLTREEGQILLAKIRTSYGKVTLINNASETWKNFNIVAYSPSVLNGTNVHIENHFDTMFVYGSPKSVVPRNLIQMWGRCRVFTVDVPTIHLFIGSNVPDKSSNELSFEKIYKTKEVFDKYLGAIHANYKKIPDFVRVAISRTIFEKNLSERFYSKILVRYIKDVLKFDYVRDKNWAEKTDEQECDKETLNVSFATIDKDAAKVKAQKATMHEKMNVEAYETYMKLPLHLAGRTDIVQTPEFAAIHTEIAKNHPDILNNLFMWNKIQHIGSKDFSGTSESLAMGDLAAYARASKFNSLVTQLNVTEKIQDEVSSHHFSSIANVVDDTKNIIELREVFELSHKGFTATSITKTIKEVFRKFLGANIETVTSGNKKKISGYDIASGFGGINPMKFYTKQ